ncbi:BREX-1 system adenine-specific DNA-methyltransferase PglX [Shewanella frigidimarina]|uniref:BREX-1 system adenine-specific DNA-methyltransferase PglX n=1 Tax=Shewanella frigidimarina TaxID=56812 RepID=UPI003D7BD117
MNTSKLKSYAPKARIAFMQAVTKRAAMLGLYQDRISEVNFEADNAIIEGRIFSRKQGQQRNQLAKRITALATHDGKVKLKDGFNQFINEMAFTWFNRFTAIRYMEINGFLDHGYRVLSNSKNAQFGEGFEILSHAADVAVDLGLDKNQIVQLMLDGDKEEQLYREILLGQCHQLSRIMPFMFETLDDATELLLPDNLTKTDSLLKALINDIPEDNWRDFDAETHTERGQIEVIGWLYQFYISEHKDAVIGKVVKREDIPAATQLFTPNWIVKYLVQNSLGRQWLATYPESELKHKMAYYIAPAEQSDDVIEQLKAITPTSIDPETIKVLDPACGSGHILVEVYEVLREIYLERGYRLSEIPELILTKNIYGLDIDDRAAQMAAFAVLMKAREDDKRIFSRIADSIGSDNEIKLNIYSLQSTENLDVDKLWADLEFNGKPKSGFMVDLFVDPKLESNDSPDTDNQDNQTYLNLLHYLKAQFIDAKNLGSLIDVDSQYQNSLKELKNKLLGKAHSSHQPIRQAVDVLLPIVEQAIVLAAKYDVVVANPPYMGRKGMNVELNSFAKKHYSNSKSDLFAMFIERGFKWLIPNGFNSMVTMQSWMFLSSYEKMRENLLDNSTIETMVHMGNGVMKIAFGTNATIFRNAYVNEYEGSFSYCENDDIGSDGTPIEFPVNNDRLKSAASNDFDKIPGKPIAYWANQSIFELFNSNVVEDHASVRQGMATTDNEKYLRYWHELDFSKIAFNSDTTLEACQSGFYWFPYNKGGAYRKWYGNFEYVVRYENNGEDLINLVKGKYPKISDPEFVIKNRSYYCREGVTWSDVTSGVTSFRYMPKGFIFDGRGSSIFPYEISCMHLIGLLNTPATIYFAELLNPTAVLNPGEIKKIPLIVNESYKTKSGIERAVSIAKSDWDSYEISWDFNSSPLSRQTLQLEQSFASYSEKTKSISSELLDIELKNNEYVYDLLEINADTIGLKIDLTDVTLKTNYIYRYKNSLSNEEKLSCYRSDTLSELVSYSLGCSMGRYSLDREGLIYAQSGNNGFKALVAQGAYKTFPADDDGIIPLAAEEWLFEDDATVRFKEFVKTVWGAVHLTENLDFVAESLCLNAITAKKGEGAMDTIRRYFSTQFYKDHLKTYKKRPIYWLFSSGKEKAFECLVYLHRYNEGTLARMRTEYVTPLMGKFETQIALRSESIANAESTAEKNRLSKELKSLEKKQTELRAFDEELKHFAEMKISLDLDDGVKVNYGKFGNLLADVKDIHGQKPEQMK